MAQASVELHLNHTDPKGYYALLGVATDAAPEEIAAAFRQQARVLHPDIPGTGNRDRFIAIRQAYDLLSDPDRRASYDRAAVASADPSGDDAEPVFPDLPAMEEPTMRRPRWSDVHAGIWVAFGLLIAVCAFQLFIRLRPTTPPSAPVQRAAPIPSNPPREPTVAPAGPMRQAGPLVGTANYYTTPGPGPIPIWRHDPNTNNLIPLGQLQPFTPVQAVRLYRQPGLMEIRLTESSTGLVPVTRLNPGDADATRRAFCIYHAGPPPPGAEVLHQAASGNGAITVRNRSASPAVVKLRDRAGLLVASLYMSPGENVRISGLPETDIRADFAFGEVWSRPCSSFAVGQRAWRMPLHQPLAALTPLVIPPDPAAPNQPVQLPDQAFGVD